MIRFFQLSLITCLFLLGSILLAIWQTWIDIIPYLSLFISFLGLFVLIPSFLFSEQSTYKKYFRIFAVLNFIVWCLFAYDIFSQAHSYWYIYIGLNLFVLMSILNSWIKNSIQQRPFLHVFLYVLVVLTVLPIVGFFQATWTVWVAKISLSLFSLILLFQGSFRKN
jgi:hypothetical protein